MDTNQKVARQLLKMAKGLSADDQDERYIEGLHKLYNQIGQSQKNINRQLEKFFTMLEDEDYKNAQNNASRLKDDAEALKRQTNSFYDMLVEMEQAIRNKSRGQ